MEIFCQSVQKHGNSQAENEDAFIVKKWPTRGKTIRELRCAIADGATQSSFSGLWARLLVENAILSGLVPSKNKLEKIILKSRNEWEESLGKINLPWYAQEKSRYGAFSSFLWLSLKTNTNPGLNGGVLKVRGVGDSEFLFIRENQIIKALPYKYPSEFSSSPTLIPSLAKNANRFSSYAWAGLWKPGDEIVLATDAVGQFLLTEFLKKDQIIEIRDRIFASNNPSDAYNDWICSLRESKQIKNDDSTLVWIKPEND